MPAISLKEDEKHKQIKKMNVIKRLLKYLLPYKKEVAITLFLIGTATATELMFPYFLKIGIDKFIIDKNRKGLICIGIIISMFCSKYRNRIMAKVTHRIHVDIRHQLYVHIQKLSFHFSIAGRWERSWQE